MARKKTTPKKQATVKPQTPLAAAVDKVPLPFVEPIPSDPASILEEEEDSASPGFVEEAEKKSSPNQ